MYWIIPLMSVLQQISRHLIYLHSGAHSTICDIPQSPVFILLIIERCYDIIIISLVSSISWSSRGQGNTWNKKYTKSCPHTLQDYAISSHPDYRKLEYKYWCRLTWRLITVQNTIFPRVANLTILNEYVDGSPWQNFVFPPIGLRHHHPIVILTDIFRTILPHGQVITLQCVLFGVVMDVI